MKEVWSTVITVHNTAGLKPRNGDGCRTRMSQSRERVMLIIPYLNLTRSLVHSG